MGSEHMEAWLCNNLALCRLFSRILDSPASQGVAQVRFNVSGEWTPVQGAVDTEGMLVMCPGH